MPFTTPNNLCTEGTRYSWGRLSATDLKNRGIYCKSIYRLAGYHPHPRFPQQENGDLISGEIKSEIPDSGISVTAGREWSGGLKISTSKNQCTEQWDSKPHLVLSVKNLTAKSILALSSSMEQAEDSFLERGKTFRYLYLRVPKRDDSLSLDIL